MLVMDGGGRVPTRSPLIVTPLHGVLGGVPHYPQGPRSSLALHFTLISLGSL